MFRSIRTIAVAAVLGVAALYGIGSGVYYALQSRQSSRLIEQWKQERNDLAGNVVTLAGKSLQNFAYDYSYWDEMLDFAATGDSAWALSNIDESLPTYDANAAWVYSPDFRLVYSANDLDDVVMIGENNLDESALTGLPMSRDELISAVTKEWFPHFFVRSSAGLIEVRGAPIQPSDDAERTTEPQGWLFVGRIWSPRYLHELSDLTGCRMALHPPSMRKEFHGRDASRPWLFTHTHPLLGWDGSPVANLCGASENTAMRQSIRQTRDGIWLHLGYVLAVVTALSLVLMRFITNPLRRISESLQREDPTLIEPLRRRQTELGRLAGLIGEFFAQRERLQREVHEHQRSLHALAESERRFRELADLLPVMVYEADEKGYLTFVNLCARETFGFDEDELIQGRSLLDMVAPEDRERTASVIRQRRENPSLRGRNEYVGVRKDGSRFSILSESCPIVRDGQVVGVRGAVMDITAMKRADAALREGEQLLRQMAEAIPSMFWMTSADQKDVLYMSPAYESIYGRSLKNGPPTVKEWRDAIYMEDQPRVFDHVQTHGQEGWEIEYRILRPDGTLRWVNERAAVVRDENGRRNRIAGLTEDVTERKESENAIRESQERFRSLSDAAPVLIWMAGVDRHCYYFNKTWLSFTGRALPQEYGKGWQQNVHPEDLERVIEIYRNAFMSRCAFTIEYRMRHTDGTYHWVFDRGAPRFGADGSFAGYIGTAVDITDRKQAEDALRSGEERFRAIFETAHDAIFIKNTRLIYTHVNPAMEKLHGRPAAHIVGRRVDELFDLETARRMEETDRHALAGETVETEFTAELKGIPTTIEVVKVPMRDRSGQIVGLCGIARDVTDRRRAAEEIAKWNQRYELIVAASGQVVYDYDVTSGRIIWSGSTERVLGYPQGTMKDNIEQWAEKVHPEDRDEALRLLSVAEKEVGTYDCEYRFRKADGDYLWMQDRGFFVADGSGRAVRMLGTMRDVSDRHRADQAMRENREYLKAIFENMRVGMFIVDAETHRIVDANPTLLQMMGAEREQVVGAVCHRWVCPAEKGECPATDLCEKVDNAEREMLTVDGRSVPVLKTVVPITLNGRRCLLESVVDITERKQFEEALQSERRIFTAGPVVAYRDRIADDWPAEYVSPNSREVMGYDPEDFTSGRVQVRDLLHPDDRQRILDETAQHLAAGTQVYEQEYRILHPDGEYRWMHDLTTVQRNADGVPTHVQGYVLDITDRKRVEQALRESEEQHRWIVENLSDLVMLTETDGVVSYLSPSCRTVLGYDAEDLVGKRLWIIHPDDAEIVTDAVARALSESRGGAVEYRIITKAGETRTVSHSWTPMLKDGKLERVVSIVSNVTARRQAEEAVQEERNLFNAGPVIVFRGRCEPGFPVEYVSDNVRSLGYTPEDFLSGRVCIRDLIHPDDGPRTLRAAMDHLASGAPFIEQEYRVRRGDGEYRWLRDTSRIVRDATGRPLYYQGYMLDVTEHRRAIEDLQESEARQRAMLSAVPDIMFRLDRDGVFLDYSAKNDKDLYAPPSEFLGKRVDEVLPPPLGETLHRMAAEVARTGVTRFTEYRLLVEGQNRTFEARMARCGDDGVLVIVRDTTVRKNAETALAETAAHYRAIVEAAPFPMVVTRVRDGYIHYCNDPFLAALGITREQVQGRSLAEFYVHPTERPFIVERLQRDGRISDHTMAVRRGDGTIVQWVGSAQMMELDGQEAVVAVVMGVMPGSEPGQSEGRTGVAVSVRHQVEELYSEIRDALLRTREALQSEQPTPKQNDPQP